MHRLLAALDDHASSNIEKLDTSQLMVALHNDFPDLCLHRIKLDFLVVFRRLRLLDLELGALPIAQDEIEAGPRIVRVMDEAHDVLINEHFLLHRELEIGRAHLVGVEMGPRLCLERISLDRLFNRRFKLTEVLKFDLGVVYDRNNFLFCLLS